MKSKVKVAINGFGVIGRRVARAVLAQVDMELVGVSDISFDTSTKVFSRDKIEFFSSSNDVVAATELKGNLGELIQSSDVVVDCTPKGIGAKNISLYKKYGIKFILQGGEKHEFAGHSFVSDSNYKEALNQESTRVVSCNTTSIVRTLTALKNSGLLKSARGVLLRRATDPWKSHRKGIVNTLVPEKEIPSHQGPDARKVDSDLDVITMAVMVPQTLAHLHYWTVQLNQDARKEDVIESFGKSSRIALVNADEGLDSVNTIKELMLDLDRPFGNLYEVAVWENLIETKGSELFYAYMVDNQAIVIPETIDAIRALMGAVKDPLESIRMTNKSLGVRNNFLEDNV